MRIAQEGEAVRILGTWVGNGTDDVVPWTTVLEKIDAVLASWDRAHPLMEGRNLVSQMEFGGRTQYLTQVQGMPEAVRKRLEKRQREWMWGGKSMTPVNIATMHAPTDRGGRKLLDIEARNEAIGLMHLKNYLDFSPATHL